MTLPYVLRLLCLRGASFFLLHLALGLAAIALTPAAARWAERMKREAGSAVSAGFTPGPRGAFRARGGCRAVRAQLSAAGTRFPHRRR